MNIEEAKKVAQDALEQLAVALERGQSEALKAYLTAMGRFYRYSLNNVLLIAAQRPDARRVAGFQAWKKLGRQVRRGEKGIVILAPIVRRSRQRKERRAATNTASESDEPAQPVAGFRRAHVFDVSQTDGEPLPEFTETRGNPGRHTEQLQALVTGRGIELDYSDRIAPAHGVSAGNRITLLPGLSPAEEFATLAHELAHSTLHSNEGNRPRNKTIRETEAEAVAFVVCQAIGLDAAGASSDYIQIHDGDTKTLAASLGRIQQTATEIITAIRADE